MTMSVAILGTNDTAARGLRAVLRRRWFVRDLAGFDVGRAWTKRGAHRLADRYIAARTRSDASNG